MQTDLKQNAINGNGIFYQEKWYVLKTFYIFHIYRRSYSSIRNADRVTILMFLLFNLLYSNHIFGFLFHLQSLIRQMFYFYIYSNAFLYISESLFLFFNVIMPSFLLKLFFRAFLFLFVYLFLIS